MHQNFQIMMRNQSLELSLSLLWRTIVSGPHTLFWRWSKKLHKFTYPSSHWNTIVLHNRLRLSSKLWFRIIIWKFWCIFGSKTLYFVPRVYYGIQYENVRGYVNFWAQLYLIEQKFSSLMLWYSVLQLCPKVYIPPDICILNAIVTTWHKI